MHGNTEVIGEWVLGDKLRDLVYTVLDANGLPFDLTGATVTLEGKREGREATASINRSGTLSGTPANGVVTFSDITNGLVLLTRADPFVCRVKVVKSSNPGWADPFSILVVEWP